VADGHPRALVGKVLMLSAATLIGAGIAVWYGLLPFGEGSRAMMAAAFVMAGVADGVVALRFLGEP
jgi:hypothetical protein